MWSENTIGITDPELIEKYIGKLMDLEVSRMLRTETEKPRYVDCVMNNYLRQDIELDFKEDFFEGHCTYAEWMSVVLDAGRQAKQQAHRERKECLEEGEILFYVCTEQECYYWAISLIVSALLRYTERSMDIRMFCSINMEALGKYICRVKCYRTGDNFFDFERLREEIGKDIRYKTIGYVLSELMKQVSAGWKCGLEPLLTYRNRVYDAQKNLEYVLCTPFASVLYPWRFLFKPVRDKYALPFRADHKSEKHLKSGAAV